MPPFGLPPSINSLSFWVSRFGEFRSWVKPSHPFLTSRIHACWPACTSGIRSRSTPAYLGRYVRAATALSRSIVHYAFSGVGSGTPTVRRLATMSLFCRSCPRRVSTAGLGSSRLSLRPGSRRPRCSGGLAIDGTAETDVTKVYPFHSSHCCDISGR